MIDIVLQPAKLREGKFVILHDEEPLTLDWPQLRDRFAATRTRQGLMLLRMLRAGTFVGTRKLVDARVGPTTRTFILDAVGRSRSVAGVLRRDPAFATDLQEVFFVQSVQWESQLQETA